MHNSENIKMIDRLYDTEFCNSSNTALWTGKYIYYILVSMYILMYE